MRGGRGDGQNAERGAVATAGSGGIFAAGRDSADRPSENIGLEAFVRLLMILPVAGCRLPVRVLRWSEVTRIAVVIFLMVTAATVASGRYS